MFTPSPGRIARRCARAAIVAFALTVSSAHAATTGGLAPAVNAIGKDSWSSAPSQATINYIAAHDSLLITDGYPAANDAVAQLHAANPNMLVIPYINGLERTSADVVFPGSCSVPMRNYVCPAGDNVVDQHPSWFLHTASGSVVYDASIGPSASVMDPANPGWIAYRQQELQWYVDNFGYNGVFFDDIFPSLQAATYNATPIDPRTGKYYTDSEWASDVTGFLAAMKSALGSNKLFINTMNTGAEYYANEAAENSYIAHADGAIEEGFMQWYNATGPRSEAGWLQDVNSIAAVAAQGKIPVGWTDEATYQTPAQINQTGLYSLSSYLLGAGDAAQRYYMFQDYQPPSGYVDPCDGQCQPADPNWTLPIGDPTGPYYQSGGVFGRNYTGGLVLVNPTDSGTSYTVSLGGTYRTPGGQVVTSVTLAPKTGTILIAVGSTANASAGSGLGGGSSTNPPGGSGTGSAPAGPTGSPGQSESNGSPAQSASTGSPAQSASTGSPAQSASTGSTGNTGSGSGTGATTYADEVLASDPVAFWQLSDESGTTAADTAGSDPGQFSGAYVLGAPGPAGGASVSLNGSGTVTVPYSPALNPTGDWSVEVWIDPSHPSGTDAMSAIESRTNSGRSGYDVGLTKTGAPYLLIGEGSAFTLLAAPKAVPQNDWTDLVATFDGTFARLYADGQLVAGPVATAYAPNTSAPLSIGSLDGVGEPFSGQIADVAVYAGALAPAAINAQFGAAGT